MQVWSLLASHKHPQDWQVLFVVLVAQLQE